MTNKTDLIPFEECSQLRITDMQDKTLVRCKGEGPTLRTLGGLAVFGAMAVTGLAFLVPVLTAPLLVPSVIYSDFIGYFLAIIIFAAPVIVGLVFSLQSYQRGWNDTVLTIAGDQINVCFEGPFARNAFSIPLSKITAMGVKTNSFGTCLFVKLFFQDFRTLIRVGTRAEVVLVEEKILEWMKRGGWSCEDIGANPTHRLFR